MTETQYVVKTPLFEGPLELLLELIEKRKLFVNEVSLAQVTDDYVSHVREMSNLNVADATNFIVVAATLILIKSRSLLPNIELTVDEKEQIVNLEARLRLYQIIKEVAQSIRQTYGKEIILLAPERNWEIEVFTPNKAITPERMRTAISDVLSAIPKKEVKPEVLVKKVVSIEEMIDSITVRIQKNMRTSFRDFAGKSFEDAREQKVYVIVSFLAMLELVRGGIIDVLQKNAFEDIEMFEAPKELKVHGTDA